MGGEGAARRRRRVNRRHDRPDRRNQTRVGARIQPMRHDAARGADRESDADLPSGAASPGRANGPPPLDFGDDDAAIGGARFALSILPLFLHAFVRCRLSRLGRVFGFFLRLSPGLQTGLRLPLNNLLLLLGLAQLARPLLPKLFGFLGLAPFDGGIDCRVACPPRLTRVST